MSESSDGASALPPVPLEPLRALDPRQLGEWRMLGRLGTGGMGVAFLSEGGGRWAVVKMIRSDLSDDRHYKARIARELEAMRRAAGPHTAALLDSDLDGDPAWFAMEFIPGMTLTRHVTDIGPLSPTEVTRLGAELAEVLAAVHAVGIVHRDLKPSNVMLSPTGPRLIDFGIADLAEGTQLTRTGAVIGSTGWLAPEQVTGDPITPATDVHAWGLCVLYAATGAAPFGADTTSSALYRVLEHTPDVPDTVPEPARALVEAALAKDPTRRPSLDRIRAALSPAPPMPPPSPAGMPPTEVVPSTDQWTELREPEAAAAVEAPAAQPPRVTPPTPPPPRTSSSSRPGRGLVILAILAVAAIVGAGTIAAVALSGGSPTETTTQGDASTPSREAPTTAPPGSASPPTAAASSGSPEPVAAAPTYGVRVNYSAKSIPDAIVKDSLDWQVDLCSTDTQLLEPVTRKKVLLYSKIDGTWTRQANVAQTEKGGRCGKDSVHIVIPATAPTPSASEVGQGWSTCQPYRVVVPETRSFAKTFLDMCVTTRADESA